ncbi:MAG: insulinase family protein [Candidatus Peribacteraceae bacterium]|nr:insulinase family protein [Candidatus Peribacteraceae bacterium]
MYTVSRLPSGLPILTAPTAGTAAITVLVFAGAGSRYEVQADRGISHFLEHMFFKGGNKYKSAADVSTAIDSVGGDFNAFTGKEYAGYYVKVSAEKVELACDVLSDMLCNARFPQEEIEKERGVIIEEYRMYQDTPMYQAGWDFETLLFGDQPLGWDTIGTEEVIRSVNQADFIKHKNDLYTADNLVVTFAGNIDEKKAMELSTKYFGSIGGKKAKNWSPLQPSPVKKVSLTQKQTEQAHLVLGVQGVSSQDKDHFAQKLLSIILGGSMSSRMFLNIREAHGLCYYISTSTDNYMDTGILSTRAGVDQSRLHEAISAIRHEYEEVAAKGVTDTELRKAKDYLKGKITLSMEDSEERAHYFGKQQLLYPHVRDLAEYFHEIEKVEIGAVNAMAKRLFTTDALRLVVIGKEKDESELLKLIS